MFCSIIFFIPVATVTCMYFQDNGGVLRVWEGIQSESSPLEFPLNTELAEQIDKCRVDVLSHVWPPEPQMGWEVLLLRS